MRINGMPFQVQITWMEGKPIIAVNLDATAAKRKVSGRWLEGLAAVCPPDTCLLYTSPSPRD